MTDKEYTMSEVENEIARIWGKNTEKKTVAKEYCNKENLENYLPHLRQELDYFDISYLNEDFNSNTLSSAKALLVQLVNSIFDIIKIHRDTLVENEDLHCQKNRAASDIKSLKKTVDSLKKEINTKEGQLSLQQEKNCLERLKNDELITKISLANKEINVINKENRASRIKHKHELQKVTEESVRLESKFRKDCGKYISRDENTIAVIEKYKSDEEKYKQTILGLQMSNQELLGEILSLRENLEYGYLLKTD